MNILVIGPTDRHTFDMINWSLNEMGHTSEIVSPVNPGLLPNKLAYNKYDLVICSRTPSLYRVLENTDVHLCVWNVDSRGSIDAYKREFGEDLIHLFESANTLYTVSKGEVEMFKEAGINARWMVQGIWSGIDNIFGDRNYIHDVSFLGGIDYLHEISGGRVTLMRRIDREFNLNTESEYEKEASKTYYNTKVNIGHAHSPELGENSVRDFKIMGSGGFLLTQWYRGIDEIFIDGVNVIYKTQDECVEKIQYYLDNEDEREEIAKKGYDYAHAKCNYRDRLEVILKNLLLV